LAYEIRGLAAHQAFLDGIEVSNQARARIRDFIDHYLPATPDDIRLDPINRRGDSGQFFAWDHFIVDFWTGEENRWHHILVLMDDSRASEGILEVVFVDHKDGPWSA
jgi:hypothetical protein